MQPDTDFQTPLIPIGVLLVAADPLARSALAALLDDREEIILLDQVSPDPDLLESIDLHDPDLLVWDFGWDASDTPPELAALHDLDTPLLALLPDETLAAAIWARGAAGLLLRDATGGDLIAAIQALIRGLCVIDPHLAAAITVTPALISEEPLGEPLTPRELEVLQLLAEGLANRAIAQELIISEHTVKFHVNAIMSKLNAQSRTEAVVRATRLGLILL